MTVQFPALSSVSAVPLTVQTVGVVEAKVTAKLDVDVAERVAGVPAVGLAGALNVMVCAVSGKAQCFTVGAMVSISISKSLAKLPLSLLGF